MKRKMRILASCVVLALASAAHAQTTPGGELDTQVRVIDNTAANRGQTQVATRIASSFDNLAGSEDNALALVRALREGTTVRLTTTAAPTGTQTQPTTTTTSFTPATGKMGWGNVRISLALAQDALLRAGITKPTAEQLQAALNGGEITGADGKAVTLTGVLQMRADGMGWGRIAQAGGTKVGPVLSSLKSTQAQLARLPATGTGGDTSTVTTAAGGGKAKGVTTAGGTAPKGRGVTTADGSSTATPGKGASRGITTAAGGPATSSPKGPSKGITTASGATSTASSRGLVTADGAISGHAPKGNAYGRGIVSAAGGGATNVAATSSGRGHGGGAGVVSASGGQAGSVSTAQGGSSADPGKGHGRGRGGGG